jgi:tryptophan-rich sensory protein
MNDKYLPILHTIVPIILAIALNAFIYAMKWNQEQKKQTNKLLPPGYVIAIVWIVILGLLGYTHYLVYPSYASFIIVIAVLYCLAYPFLTSGLRSENADVFNMLSLIAAVIVAVSVASKNTYAVVYTVPFVLWSTYVNVVTRM